jgi:Asp-tRNA(Asn)/Glu-tRNA(Gln) amidotransferase A subunit family amidase
MLPIATGSQVRGSVIRPASICGVIGMKPTFGTLNRHGGVDPSPSLNHLGLLGGTLTDVWETAQHIGAFAGSDPGYLPFAGPPTLPEARQPLRLARQYTAGWPRTDTASQAAFEGLLQSLKDEGVEILEPGSAEFLKEYEEATARTPEFFFDLMTFELRWPLALWNEQRPGLVSEAIEGYIQKAQSLTVEDYRRASDRREQLRALHRQLQTRVDGFITLAHIGPGQLGQPKSGTPWYNDASSAVGAPTFNLPLLAIDGAPLGVQVMGFEHRDGDLAAIARWLLATRTPQMV